MVPGMTERDRRIADMQRLEWLASARFGPAHVAVTTHHQCGEVFAQTAAQGGSWWRRVLPTLFPGRRQRLHKPAPISPGGRALESLFG